MNGRHLDADWYRVKYNLAAQSLNYALAHRGADSAEDRRAQAERHARELVVAAGGTLDATGGRRARKVHGGLRAFLVSTGQPAAAVLYAGAVLARGMGRAYPERWRRGPIEDRAELSEAVRDAVVTPAAIVGFVVRLAPVGYRVDYNLACYLATLSQAMATANPHPDEIRSWADPEPETAVVPERRAFRALVFAIERAPARKGDELVEWARHDPALRPVVGRDDARRYLSATTAVERLKYLVAEGVAEGFGAAAEAGYRPTEGARHPERHAHEGRWARLVRALRRAR